MVLDNGSPIEIVNKLAEKANEENFPDNIKIITGNLFPKKDSLSFKNDINGELQRRYPRYTVKEENDITLYAGMIKVEFTKN